MSAPSSRVLITGVGGQVGAALLERSPAFGLTPLPTRRADLDLGRPEAIAAILDGARPAMVVNCAAYTAVDQAEQDGENAFAINATGPAALADWCGRSGVPLVHLSTDYVFPGDARRPYREDDPISPLGVYGSSKAAGEQLVRAACAHHVILRTAWVYAANGKNFVRTMLRLGAEREALDVVDDQRGCPTAAASIAEAICIILERLQKGDREAIAGTYHYVDGGETTWFGLAEHLFRRVEPAWGRRPLVRPITTDRYPTPARRPQYSVLDTTKFQSTFGMRPPVWQISLDGVLQTLGLLPDHRRA